MEYRTGYRYGNVDKLRDQVETKWQEKCFLEILYVHEKGKVGSGEFL